MFLLHYSESAELCFLDATGNCDRNCCRVFLLMSQVKAGGVPLGLLGIEMLKMTTLPAFIFNPFGTNT